MAWTAVAHAAGNFTGSGSLTWTVDSGDQQSYAYQVLDKTMDATAYLTGTSTGGTADSQLRVAIPGGYVAKRLMGGSFYYNDNGTIGTGFWQVTAGGTTINLLKSSGNWSNASSNNTSVVFTARFEVQ